ncbi:FAD-dependent oxidoreductase [Lentilactobacillus sp. Marseille-Q4993]|uniref:FAD-dependent oxidoreductase n=1 Tax=Lentilactobacillus sp. Marseille-Q4993 TaxID=3039492 RepID=UPI0032DE4336
MAYQTEVVVVGAGAGGMGAALTAVDAGKQVILLEKGNKIGGAGMFGAQGLFAVESDQQKAAGSSFTVRDAYLEMMDYTHYRSNPNITKAILAKSADTINWLDQHGLQTELVNNTQEVHQSRPKVYHQYIDKFAAFDRMINYFQEKGGKLLTETAAKKVQTKDGQVSGVEIVHDGKTEVIECQAVIVSDGGYIGNADMVKDTLTIDSKDLYSMGERKATGDGIRMLAEIGADTSSVGTFENHAASVDSHDNPKWHNQTIFTLTNLPFMWVNREGDRFVDESVCYDFALWGNITYTMGGFYYFLLDQKTVDYLQNNELDWTDSFERTFKSLQHEAVTHKVGPFEKIDSDLQEAVDNGAAWKAESLDELATKLNVPSDELKQSVDSYNQLVEAGEDNQFYKPSKFVKFSVEQGPFYAVRANSTSLGTIGGIRTNEKMEALTPDNKAVSGAYVAGNNATGMYDTSYPTMEGISCAFAWNSGRIAAESAVERLNK